MPHRMAVCVFRGKHCVGALVDKISPAFELRNHESEEPGCAGSRQVIPIPSERKEPWPAIL
jgi:hypothetical protein